jgi:hypothetical protein
MFTVFMNSFIPVSCAPWHPRYTFHCRDSLGEKYVQTILFFLKPSNQAVKMRHCIFLPLFNTVLLLCTVKNICFSPSFCKIRKKVLRIINKGDRIQYIRQHWVSRPHAQYGSAAQIFSASRLDVFCDLFLQLYSVEAILPRLNCSQVDTSVRSYKRFYPKTEA